MADGFDWSDIGGNSQGQNSGMFSSPVEVRQPTKPAVTSQPSVPTTTANPEDVGATLSKPTIDPKKQALADSQGISMTELFDPLSEARQGGQFKAGEVDKKQEEFLKNTQWDTSETKDRIEPNRKVK